MYVFQSFASFFPTFLVEHHGLSQPRASLLFGVAFVLAAAFLPVAGRLADHASRDAVLAGVLAAAATGFAAVVFGGGPLLFGSVVVLGVGLSWGGVLQARFMANFAEAERGTGFGLVRTTFILLGAVGNAVTGVLADIAGWTAAYGVVVALLVLAVGAMAVNEVLDLGL
jgi:MFS family permease